MDHLNNDDLATHFLNLQKLINELRAKSISRQRKRQEVKKKLLESAELLRGLFKQYNPRAYYLSCCCVNDSNLKKSELSSGTYSKFSSEKQHNCKFCSFQSDILSTYYFNQSKNVNQETNKLDESTRSISALSLRTLSKWIDLLEKSLLSEELFLWDLLQQFQEIDLCNDSNCSHSNDSYLLKKSYLDNKNVYNSPSQAFISTSSLWLNEVFDNLRTEDDYGTNDEPLSLKDLEISPLEVNLPKFSKALLVSFSNENDNHINLDESMIESSSNNIRRLYNGDEKHIINNSIQNYHPEANQISPYMNETMDQKKVNKSFVIKRKWKISSISNIKYLYSLSQ